MTTLLSLVEALARDPGAKADYASGPDGYLERHGFGDLSPADVNEAVHHASDALPPAAAAQVEPGDGLASVAEVDPDAFEPGVATTFEDDLFGLDPGDDELEPAAGALEQTPATDQEPDDAALAGDQGDHSEDAPDAAQRLSTLPDPNDLDGDDLTVAGQRGAAAAPASPAVSGDDGPAPDVDDAPAGLTPVADIDDDGTSTEAGFADVGLDPSSFSPDDPFATGDPLHGSGDEPWYQQSSPAGYDVEPPEPQADILDDVDDIDLDGS